jgi:excisionase family DNA binding protein
MQQLQLISITPEQLESKILQGVQSQLQELKSSFQPKEPTEYLTRQEVSELLKVNLSTVHNWTKNGTLISYGIGGSRIYYKRSELEEALVKLDK